MIGSRLFLGAALSLLIGGLSGCESPYQAFDAVAADYDFQRIQVEGEGFDHVAFRKSGVSGPLHVYLASDGRPWLRHQLPAGDPTSRESLVLDLMALDPAESVLLGRPCYHGLQDTPPCEASLWTARRYAPEVVESLVAALRNVEGDARRPLVLIGHSGGGVLAMLLAGRLPAARAVVTIAAPLDHSAWTSHHRYLPLEGSLNPVLAAPLPETLQQLHFAGGRDSVVPHALVSRALAQLDAPPALVIAAFDHHDGWVLLWPSVLSCLRTLNQSETMAEADQDKLFVAPGVTEVAVVSGSDGSPLIECDRH